MITEIKPFTKIYRLTYSGEDSRYGVGFLVSDN